LVHAVLGGATRAALAVLQDVTSVIPVGHVVLGSHEQLTSMKRSEPAGAVLAQQRTPAVVLVEHDPLGSDPFGV
jgi:hypothetical protein